MADNRRNFDRKDEQFYQSLRGRPQLREAIYKAYHNDQKKRQDKKREQAQIRRAVQSAIAQAPSSQQPQYNVVMQEEHKQEDNYLPAAQFGQATLYKPIHSRSGYDGCAYHTIRLSRQFYVRDGALNTFTGATKVYWGGAKTGSLAYEMQITDSQDWTDIVAAGWKRWKLLSLSIKFNPVAISQSSLSIRAFPIQCASSMVNEFADLPS